MGHGAPKKFDVIATQKVVELYAMEALVREAMDKVSGYLSKCLEGSESPEDWKQLDEWRQRLVQRNQLFTLTILNLKRSQERG